jgi:hypothetical protein
MSTISSYFKARKNKSTPVYIGGKVNQPGIVVQSPEEKTLVHQSATRRQNQIEKPTGILRFMSPIKQHEKKEEKKEEEEEEHIVCKIKKSTKITDFWKDVVQNYDVDSTLDVKTGREKRSHGDDSERVIIKKEFTKKITSG